MNFIKKRVFLHILFWIGIFVFYISSTVTRELFEQSLITNLFKLPLLMFAAYSFNYWQVPVFLKQKKYTTFIISMIIVVFSLVTIFRFMGYFYLDQFCEYGPYPLLSFADFPIYMLTFHLPALIMYFYKTNKEQELEKKKIIQLEKEKIATELKYLKAQLNPHFLFNTLNNLYSYVITKSPKAPDMVLQLSEILDYILYKSQQPTVSLTEEIHTIENYIALEQIKYAERLQVSFEKDKFTNNHLITPLILLSVVENAFKHGVSGSITKSKVKIALKQTENGINFSVWNTKTDTIHNLTDTYKSGIGLTNIKRQLDLIYPNKHTLETNETKVAFELKLTLKID